MNYEEIILKVSRDLDLPKDFVDKVYKGYWKAIKEIIAALPLKNDITEEEFQKLRTNINIPSLGKLNCTYNRYKLIRQNYKLIKEYLNNAKS